MTREDLIRRINEALDSSEGLEGDLELQRLFVRDAAASDLADELARIDGALRAWPSPVRTAEGWEALATRIEQRLDEPLPAIEDPTAPPRLADERAEGEAAQAPAPPLVAPAGAGTSGEFSLAVLTGRGEEDPPAPPSEDGERFSFSDLAVAPPRVSGGIPGFIDVQSASPPTATAKPRRTGVWLAGALAAAAAVGLAVVGGTATLSTAPDAEQAQATPSPAAAEAEAAPPAPSYDVPGAAPAVQVPAEEPVAEAEESSLAEMRSAPLRRAREQGPARPRAVAEGARGGGSAPERTTGEPRVRREATARQATEAAEEVAQAEATGGGGQASGGTADRTSASRDLPDSPDRDSVVAALRAVQPLVEACFQEQHGVATVEITVGSSGRVRSALVTGFFAGTTEGSCIARAVRRARFPQFRQETFRVTYPFQL